VGNFGKIDVAGRPRTGPNIAGHEELRPETVKAFPDEPLRAVVYRMAEKGVTQLPVVEAGTRKFLGLVSLNDLLKARTRHLEEERRRERVLNLRFFLPGAGAQDETQSPAAP
jgi:CBS domain-containing protein